MTHDKNIYTNEQAVLVKHIRLARESAGLTQQEMAHRLGKRTHSAIVKMEQGQVRIEVLELRRICQIVGISFIEFIDRLERELEDCTKCA